MSAKFDNIPTESDTVILFQVEGALDGYDLMYQKWAWCSYRAESFIFSAADISGLSDEEVETLSRTSPLVKSDSEVTITRKGSDFVFVNFNFEDSDDDEPWEDKRTDEERKIDREKTIRYIGQKNREEVARFKK
ncbi:hypothetical protein [Thiocapsa marina]|uniref:hypothetical protein n=1 Tax=Thiocapsa marina TaxID=244573 RepID=UPI000681E4C2|nr:hypothetical protein [Thiocapsa marina]